jgi:hypothetical protein
MNSVQILQLLRASPGLRAQTQAQRTRAGEFALIRVDRCCLTKANLNLLISSDSIFDTSIVGLRGMFAPGLKLSAFARLPSCGFSRGRRN